MADAPSSGGQPDGDGEALVLLLLIVRDKAVLDDVVTAMLDLGVAGTVIESRGLMAIVRDEMPVFSGLAALMPTHTGSRVVLSVVSAQLAGWVFEYLRDELGEKERPIAVTVPVGSALGVAP